MPTISVIIPTYNSARFIRRTISSVLNQSYTDWELLVIDDKSTDNTIELVEKFSRQDARIKFYQTNMNSGGPAGPKNLGLRKARGEYVAFLDHDDEWSSDKLSKQLECFKDPKYKDLGLVYCWVKIKDSRGEIISRYKKGYQGRVMGKISDGNFILSSSCMMLKADIFQKIGFFDQRFKLFDDWDMWLRCAAAGYEFDFVQQFLVDYSVHQDNACYGRYDINKSEFMALYEKHRQIFLANRSKESGRYYFYKHQYRLARKYFFRTIFSKSAGGRQRMVSIIYIFLSICPNSEHFVRKLFLK
jgi:glycosyltransferase involved in cell wall biosynthesis